MGYRVTRSLCQNNCPFIIFPAKSKECSLLDFFMGRLNFIRDMFRKGIGSPLIWFIRCICPLCPKARHASALHPHSFSFTFLYITYPLHPLKKSKTAPGLFSFQHSTKKRRKKYFVYVKENILITSWGFVIFISAIFLRKKHKPFGIEVAHLYI